MMPGTYPISTPFQYNLARGIAGLAIHAARDRIPLVVLSGGVAYNRAIRETIADQVTHAGLRKRYQCRVSSGGRLHIVWAVQVCRYVERRGLIVTTIRFLAYKIHIASIFTLILKNN